MRNLMQLLGASVVMFGVGLTADGAAAGREAGFDAVVAADGTGSYRTVQAAIAAAPDESAQPYRIRIQPGTYLGQIIVPKAKRNLHLVGTQTETTVLTYDLNVKQTNSATDLRFKGTGVIVLGADFRAENITFQNTAGDDGQALALRVDGDRAVFSNCRMLGWQDTLMANHGRQYFTNCYIEGRVDFIFGSATAVFDRCTIHSKNGGYVTAASTPVDREFGFVFLDCTLTGDEVPWVNPATAAPVRVWKQPNAYLGRPWRPHAQVAFIRCEMANHIKPEGWHNWGKTDNEQTARFREYQNTGPGANPTSRVPWSRQLNATQASAYTVENVLRGKDEWNPAREK